MTLRWETMSRAPSLSSDGDTHKGKSKKSGKNWWEMHVAEMM